ncbi:MAG: hypothetical protein E2O53_00360 [Gammaproteobacteria bacterium]|nr:MAG: hypothetical protein E2O53_00360 [Gammaproteobacteria bacterium]
MRPSLAEVVAKKMERDEARFEAINTVIKLLDRRVELMDEISEASANKFTERIHKLEKQVEQLIASR